MTSIHHMAGQVSAAKHVVFVHGLGGDYRDTWMGGIQRQEFWPEWLSDDVPGLCIWSIEYDSTAVSVTDAGTQFQDLAENIFDAFLLPTPRFMAVLGGADDIMARVTRSPNDAGYMAANRINSGLAQRGTSIYGTVSFASRRSGGASL